MRKQTFYRHLSYIYSLNVVMYIRTLYTKYNFFVCLFGKTELFYIIFVYEWPSEKESNFIMLRNPKKVHQHKTGIEQQVFL